MQNFFSVPDFQHLAFPALLLAFYVISWLVAGRDPKIENVAPRYEPPAGFSPGVARYVLTGGSDGTTLAAVLTGLAAKGVVSIQPQDGNYAVQLLNSSTTVLPDEASVLRTLFNTEQTVRPYADSSSAIVGNPDVQKSSTSASVNMASPVTVQPIRGSSGADAASAAAVGLAPSASTMAIVNPRAGAEIKAHIDALQDTFRKNLQGVYFRQNFIYAGLGMAATLAWGLFVAATLQESSSMFITFWLFFFTSCASLVIGGVWTSKPARSSMKQRITRAVLPIIFFGLPGAVIYFAALPQSHGFVLALLCSVLLNSIFFIIMRAPTSRGLMVLQQLAGFREFLMRVEQDRLDRVNTPEQRAELMNRFLPYAIALNVREGWGDKMASDFSDAIVER
ncbi:MAG TPA: hypothetical protein VNB54_02795 [Alphaproteobacteria bacterium]|nr:hypothetical protein [Alphaproteobacteria bacterium]